MRWSSRAGGDSHALNAWVNGLQGVIVVWDPCAVVPANPAYVRHPGELPGAQRLAVLVVEFSRGSGRQLETLAPRPGDAASDLAEQDGRERAGLTGRARTLVTRMRRSGSAFTFGLRSAYGLKTHLWILTRAQRALRAPRSAFTRDLQLRTFRTPSSHELVSILRTSVTASCSKHSAWVSCPLILPPLLIAATLQALV